MPDQCQSKVEDRGGRTVQLLTRGALFVALLRVTETAGFSAALLIKFSVGTTSWQWWPVTFWGAFLGVPAIWLLPVVFPARHGVRRGAWHSGHAHSGRSRYRHLSCCIRSSHRF